MPRFTDEFLREVVGVWQRRSSEQLTLEDGRQIVTNLVGYFNLLARWSKEAEEARNGNRSTQSTLEPRS